MTSKEQSQIRVLFLYLNKTLPSSRIRVLNIESLIRKQGISCEFKQFPCGFMAKITLLHELPQFDVVFLQKKLLNRIEHFLFFKYAKKTIFDFDDAIYCRDNSKNRYKSSSRLRRFRSVIKSSDLVIAGNHVLADAAKKDNEKIVILPSPVPVNDIEIKSYPSEQMKFIVGWVGGKGNLFHFDLIASELKRLSAEHDIEVHVISDGTLEIPDVIVKNIPWSIETQNSEIAKFDVGLMPLFDNPWTRGKCGYKALQYMASAVPAICSDVGGNADLIDHEVSGFKAKSANDFYKYIKKMINERDTLQVMGKAARKKIVESCSNEIVAKNIANIIQEI